MPRWLKVAGALTGVAVVGVSVGIAIGSDSDPVRIERMSDFDGVPMDAEVEPAMDFRDLDTLTEAFAARSELELSSRGVPFSITKAQCYSLAQFPGPHQQCSLELSNFTSSTFTVDVASDGSSWELLTGRAGGPR